ncbi:hypothetical protein Ancab_012515 [Ancistrocladus abbreviatus]
MDYGHSTSNPDTISTSSHDNSSASNGKESSENNTLTEGEVKTGKPNIFNSSLEEHDAVSSLQNFSKSKILLKQIEGCYIPASIRLCPNRRRAERERERERVL